MFLNIAMQMKDFFYKLVALGLGTIYGFQVLLSIGGDIKFIPSTGVTLPLVSYGGSSLLSTLIIFAIIQGLYVLRERTEVESVSGSNRKKKSVSNNYNNDVERKGTKRKGGGSSNEENIHGTKVQNLDKS